MTTDVYGVADQELLEDVVLDLDVVGVVVGGADVGVDEVLRVVGEEVIGSRVIETGIRVGVVLVNGTLVVVMLVDVVDGVCRKDH